MVNVRKCRICRTPKFGNDICLGCGSDLKDRSVKLPDPLVSIFDVMNRELTETANKLDERI